jgi:hypothetical protein
VLLCRGTTADFVESHTIAFASYSYFAVPQDVSKIKDKRFIAAFLSYAVFRFICP